MIYIPFACEGFVSDRHGNIVFLSCAITKDARETAWGELPLKQLRTNFQVIRG